MKMETNKISVSITEVNTTISFLRIENFTAKSPSLLVLRFIGETIPVFTISTPWGICKRSLIRCMFRYYSRFSDCRLAGAELSPINGFFFMHLHFKLGVAYRFAVRRSVRGCRYARAEIPARACTKGRMLQHTPLSPPAANACPPRSLPGMGNSVYMQRGAACSELPETLFLFS